jgi:hypothetical protein
VGKTNDNNSGSGKGSRGKQSTSGKSRDSDDRYVKWDNRGRFKESHDTGRSIADKQGHIKETAAYPGDPIHGPLKTKSKPP